MTGRVVAFLRRGAGQFAAVVKLDETFRDGASEHAALVLDLAGDSVWSARAKVVARLFQLDPTSLVVSDGRQGERVEGVLVCERSAFILEDAFQEAQTASGTRLIDTAQLAELVAYARARGDLIRNIETYELRDGLELPRIDLGLYGLDESVLDRPQSERIDLAAAQVTAILLDAAAEGGCFGFQVWI